MPYGKILIIDDDAPYRRIIAEYLSKQGMETFLASRIDNITMGMAEKADVIVLSNNLLDKNAGSSISALCGYRKVPLIITASACDEINSIMLMRLGVDDIIVKPFDIAKLFLKIRTLLRRYKGSEIPSDVKHTYNGLCVDIRNYKVTVEDTEIELSPKEIELLYLLISHPDRAFCHSEIASRVWGRILSDNRTISVHINRIKKKIGIYSDNIISIRGYGYKFADKAHS
ncbi:MAG: response regulator transcription factor [Oscillospiraceae bacterium]|nr:response regulator transcription factor [Oscillospiraceae bacterium]